VLGAQEKISKLEYDLFTDIRDKTAREVEDLSSVAKAFSELDCLCSMAVTASDNGYTRPRLRDDKAMLIEEGRHPVIERMAPEEFIPNDIKLDNSSEQLLIITGPNMAGKSTILRQTALISLMAQIGSFVPAKSASLCIVDKIFTRVGAHDRLTSGFSTFMVEMMETSNIIHNATENSRIILDEIGRGTSTFDGVSIAWAVAEHIHDRIGAKTLFATHYHELCDLIKVKERVRNYSVNAKEWEGRLIFLRKLIKGPVNRSYGIEVAKLAGIPDTILERSREILGNLESGEYDTVDMPKIAKSKEPGKDKASAQLALFKELEGMIAKELKDTDLNSLTPIEAMNILNRWKSTLG
jgi:DNA mismatch repair protein MutS